MTRCDGNLVAELVLSFLRTPVQTECEHLKVYDNYWRGYWTCKFKLLGKRFSRPKVDWMVYKKCACIKCVRGGCAHCGSRLRRCRPRKKTAVASAT